MGIMNQMRDKMHIMLIILVVAFMGTIIFDWGMNYLGSKGVGGGPRGVVGIINGTEIPYDDYFRQIQNEYMRVKEITGSEPNELRLHQIRDEVWDRIVNQTLLQEEIEKYNIKVSDEEIIYTIKNNPPEYLKQNPTFLTDGEFDPQKYMQAVANPDVDWSQIEQYIRLSKPSQKIQNLVMSTVRVTSTEIEKQIELTDTKGQADYILSKPSDFGNTPVTITDEEIKNYYKTHKDDFKEDEQCKLKYVTFKVTTTKEDTEIVLEDAQHIIDRLKSGEDFAELAVIHSKDPSADNGGDLGYFSKGDMVKEFEEAAFSADTGGIVGPVKTTFGYHIIKVTDLKKTRSGKIDSVRASHILLKVEPSMETINNVKYAAEDFAEAAKEKGFEKAAENNSLTINETPDFKNTGFIPNIGMLYSATSFAFKGKEGDISEPLGTEDITYVFKISKKTPEHIIPLEEAKSTIERTLTQRKRMDFAEEKINKVHSGIQSGKSFTQAANENDMIIEHTGDFGYFDYITNIGSDIKFTTAALKMNPGEISGPVEIASGWSLIQLTEKTNPDTSISNEKMGQFYWSILESQKQEVFTSWLESLRNKADIKDYRDKYF